MQLCSLLLIVSCMSWSLTDTIFADDNDTDSCLADGEILNKFVTDVKPQCNILMNLDPTFQYSKCSYSVRLVSLIRVLLDQAMDQNKSGNDAIRNAAYFWNGWQKCIREEERFRQLNRALDQDLIVALQANLFANESNHDLLRTTIKTIIRTGEGAFTEREALLLIACKLMVARKQSPPKDTPVTLADRALNKLNQLRISDEFSDPIVPSMPEWIQIQVWMQAMESPDCALRSIVDSHDIATPEWKADLFALMVKRVCPAHNPASRAKRFNNALRGLQRNWVSFDLLEEAEPAVNDQVAASEEGQDQMTEPEVESEHHQYQLNTIRMAAILHNMVPNATKVCDLLKTKIGKDLIYKKDCIQSYNEMMTNISQIAAEYGNGEQVLHLIRHAYDYHVGTARVQCRFCDIKGNFISLVSHQTRYDGPKSLTHYTQSPSLSEKMAQKMSETFGWSSSSKKMVPKMAGTFWLQILSQRARIIVLFTNTSDRPQVSTAQPQGYSAGQYGRARVHEVNRNRNPGDDDNGIRRLEVIKECSVKKLSVSLIQWHHDDRAWPQGGVPDKTSFLKMLEKYRAELEVMKQSEPESSIPNPTGDKFELENGFTEPSREPSKPNNDSITVHFSFYIYGN